MSKYISKENLNHIVQEMGKKVNIIDDLTNEELQEVIDAFEPEFVPEDEDASVTCNHKIEVYNTANGQYDLVVQAVTV